MDLSALQSFDRRGVAAGEWVGSKKGVACSDAYLFIGCSGSVGVKFCAGDCMIQMPVTEGNGFCSILNSGSKPQELLAECVETFPGGKRKSSVGLGVHSVVRVPP